MGKKTDSLFRLQDLNLNTPNFAILKSLPEIDYFFSKHNKAERVSVRTDVRVTNSTTWDLPFAPNIPADEARGFIETTYALWGERLQYIVSEGIDPEGCQMAGKYLKDGDMELIEYHLGPGTVRDVDMTIPLTLNLPIKSFDFKGVELLPEINNVLKDINRSNLGDCIVEFSIYEKPIGRLRQRRIFWEII